MERTLHANKNVIVKSLSEVRQFFNQLFSPRSWSTMCEPPTRATQWIRTWSNFWTCVASTRLSPRMWWADSISCWSPCSGFTSAAAGTVCGDTGSSSWRRRKTPRTEAWVALKRCRRWVQNHGPGQTSLPRLTRMSPHQLRGKMCLVISFNDAMQINKDI